MRSVKTGIVLALVLTIISGFGSVAVAEEYPLKPMEFLIPFGAGGSADLMGRALAEATGKYLGQKIVPINKPGASGAVMYTALHNAKPDGYTIGWNSTSIVTTTTIGNVPFKYDAFENICRIGFTAMPIVVRSDSPWKTFEEFIEYAKKHPFKIKVGNAGTGSGTHLISVLIEKEADIKLIHLPLGAKRRIPSLLGGEVEAICVPLPAATAIVKSGQARILVMPSEKRDPAFPDIPTLKEKGYPIVLELFRGISLPQGTPEPVIKKLTEAFKKGAQSPGFINIAKKKRFNVSFMGKDEFAEYLKKQSEIVAKAMKIGGLIE